MCDRVVDIQQLYPVHLSWRIGTCAAIFSELSARPNSTEFRANSRHELFCFEFQLR